MAAMVSRSPHLRPFGNDGNGKSPFTVQNGGSWENHRTKWTVQTIFDKTGLWITFEGFLSPLQDDHPMSK